MEGRFFRRMQGGKSEDILLKEVNWKRHNELQEERRGVKRGTAGINKGCISRR